MLHTKKNIFGTWYLAFFRGPIPQKIFSYCKGATNWGNSICFNQIGQQSTEVLTLNAAQKQVFALFRYSAFLRDPTPKTIFLDCRGAKTWANTICFNQISPQSTEVLALTLSITEGGGGGVDSTPLKKKIKYSLMVIAKVPKFLTFPEYINAALEPLSRHFYAFSAFF